MLKIGMAFFLIMVLGFPAFSLGLRDQEKEYLQDHCQEIELGAANFPLLENYLEDYSIFLAGKNQGLAYNSQLQMDLLQFLHQEAGVKYLLVEAPFASGEFINRYLETGEEEYLELVITYWRRSKERFDFFRDLKEYNSKFPEEEQIRVIGMDLQGPPRTLISIKYLGDLLMDTRIPLDLEYFLLPLVSLAQDFIELRQDPDHPLRAQTEYRAGIPGEMIESAREIARDILDHWKEDSEPYRELLDQPEHFYLVLNNIVDAFIMEEKLREGIEASHQFRSDRAFSNLLFLLEGMEGEKFFGQWEELNVFQKKFRGVDWLGAKLAGPDSPFNDRVMSIWYVYHDSQQMQPFSPGEVVDFDSTYIMRNLEELTELAPGKLSIFKLDAPGSPFSQGQFFLEDVEENIVSTDFFQYLLLIKESPAASPFYQP